MDDLWTWSDDAVDLTPEQNRWRARDVSYYRGPWDRLKKLIPSFELAPFRTDKDGSENRHLRMVVRQPVAQTVDFHPELSRFFHREVSHL